MHRREKHLGEQGKLSGLQDPQSHMHAGQGLGPSGPAQSQVLLQHLLAAGRHCEKLGSATRGPSSHPTSRCPAEGQRLEGRREEYAWTALAEPILRSALLALGLHLTPTEHDWAAPDPTHLWVPLWLLP